MWYLHSLAQRNNLNVKTISSDNLTSHYYHLANLNTKENIKRLSQHPIINKPLAAYSKKEYATLLFVFRETLAGFARHNIMGLSASLSFYSLFALIPLILLIFYLLSHLVFSSDYAIVKLAILTSKIMPDFSAKIMTEVYQASNSKVAWGALGFLLLFWTITPLARAMRTSFYQISSISEPPSFFKAKLRDILSVLGILSLFFAFTAAGFLVDEVTIILSNQLPDTFTPYIGGGITLLITTLLIGIFYKMFFPMRILTRHILIGALLTAILWLLMRPAFSLFLTINQNYGAVFGSMKNMFVSITWLYVNFAVFLLGSVLVSTLRKQDALLLKGLFDDLPDKANYIEALMQRYGQIFREGDIIFNQGNTDRNLYFLASGTVNLKQNNTILRKVSSNEYFGETSSLTGKPTSTDAVTVSKEASVIVIYAENIDTMLSENPKVAIHLLKQIAFRLDNNSQAGQ